MPLQSSVRKRRRQAGFSLLEVMVASALTAVVVIVMVNLLQTAMNLWERESTDFEVVPEARHFKQFMATHLPAAKVAQGSFALVENVVMGGEPVTPNSQESLFFVAPNFLSGGGSDICAFALRYNSTDSTIDLAVFDSATTWAVPLINRFKPAGFNGAAYDAQFRPILKGAQYLEFLTFTEAQALAFASAKYKNPAHIADTYELPFDTLLDPAIHYINSWDSEDNLKPEQYGLKPTLIGISFGLVDPLLVDQAATLPIPDQKPFLDQHTQHFVQFLSLR